LQPPRSSGGRDAAEHLPAPARDARIGRWVNATSGVLHDARRARAPCALDLMRRTWGQMIAKGPGTNALRTRESTSRPSGLRIRSSAARLAARCVTVELAEHRRKRSRPRCAEWLQTVGEERERLPLPEPHHVARAHHQVSEQRALRDIAALPFEAELGRARARNQTALPPRAGLSWFSISSGGTSTRSRPALVRTASRGVWPRSAGRGWSTQSA